MDPGGNNELTFVLLSISIEVTSCQFPLSVVCLVLRVQPASLPGICRKIHQPMNSQNHQKWRPVTDIALQCKIWHKAFSISNTVILQSGHHLMRAKTLISVYFFKGATSHFSDDIHKNKWLMAWWLGMVSQNVTNGTHDSVWIDQCSLTNVTVVT